MSVIQMVNHSTYHTIFDKFCGCHSINVPKRVWISDISIFCVPIFRMSTVHENFILEFRWNLLPRPRLRQVLLPEVLVQRDRVVRPATRTFNLKQLGPHPDHNPGFDKLFWETDRYQDRVHRCQGVPTDGRLPLRHPSSKWGWKSVWLGPVHLDARRKICSGKIWWSWRE